MTDKKSPIMRLFNRLGFKALSFSLRRLYCPVSKDALVLEVGSGGNPYPRANVLCDAYEETLERHFVPLVHDRPTVLGFAENLPFRDDSFDFVIAAHVLEHSRDPEKFIAEFQRVAKAGYIETPDAFMERICPYPMHSLEVSDNDGVLEIRKKSGPVQDHQLFGLFRRAVAPIFPDWIRQDPYRFHVRYFWEKSGGGIKYKMLNPEYKFDWPAPESEPPAVPKRSAREIPVAIARSLFSQRRRNKNIKLEALLRCPNCEASDFEMNLGSARCRKCSKNYPVLEGGMIDFTK